MQYPVPEAADKGRLEVRVQVADVLAYKNTTIVQSSSCCNC